MARTKQARAKADSESDAPKQGPTRQRADQMEARGRGVPVNPLEVPGTVLYTPAQLAAKQLNDEILEFRRRGIKHDESPVPGGRYIWPDGTTRDAHGKVIDEGDTEAGARTKEQQDALYEGPVAERALDPTNYAARENLSINLHGARHPDGILISGEVDDDARATHEADLRAKSDAMVRGLSPEDAEKVRKQEEKRRREAESE